MKILDNLGYYSEEVDKLMESLGLLDAWGRWFDGQTGGITKDGLFVYYPYDVHRFLYGMERAARFDFRDKKITSLEPAEKITAVRKELEGADYVEVKIPKGATKH